ncbi:MAG: glycosyltransferase family protein [Bacteroidota bacterium]|nr:glycosyltransferase family protein [Candidatus Kapabacteria bacterium]MDW8219242.1 glycosyltransferase family protein [Bacteroidota bacterium]
MKTRRIAEHSRIIASIEARMTSSRLPGKVLMEAGGKPLLQILIERLRKSRYINDIVVATTTNPQDDPIVELCQKLGVSSFRGSELNVLERVCGAAQYMNADVLVEITADCPLLDISLTDGVIEEFLRVFPERRYCSNSGPAISMPWGFDTQVFLAEDLYAILDDNPDDDDKEHVSYRFYRPESGDKYKPHFITYTGELNRPELRVTLDYPEDYTLIKAAYEHLYPQNPYFTAVDVIRWLDANPELRDAAIRVRAEREHA